MGCCVRQWWFIWAEGQEVDSRRVVRNSVKKLIPQMIYEARIQAVIYYHIQVLGKEIHRTVACQTHITLEEYKQAHKCEDAWQQIAQKRWCNEQWLKASRAVRERRLLMGGATHRQGSSSMARYKKHLEKKKQRPVSDVEAYVDARRDERFSQLEARLQEEIEARQRLEQMLLQGTAGLMVDPAASGANASGNANAEDGARVSCLNEDHVNVSIAERPPPGACYFHDLVVQT
uniref:PH01B001G05.9 protein n=1 Tax=Phyllostachys edulis TaxID=38705 RepID=L0P1J0_PHYED|nr:PH01B001G05.9 [Phyllostachys edulis]